MEFGSDEMKELLLDSCGDPEKFHATMETVMQVVMDYTEQKLRKKSISRKNKTKNNGAAESKWKVLTTDKIPVCDYEIIQSDVYYKVCKSMDSFILSLQNGGYTPAQRQAWLKTIVFRAVADYYKKKKERSKKEFLTKEIKNEKDGTKTWKEIEGLSGEILFHDTDTVVKLVEAMNRKNSRPEILLTVMLNVFVFREIFHRQTNSDSEAIAKYMEGKSLYHLTCVLVKYMYKIYGVWLKKKHISSLVNAFGVNGEQTEYGKMICSRKEQEGKCTITAKYVTDWSNRMKTYLLKQDILPKEGV